MSAAPKDPRRLRLAGWLFVAAGALFMITAAALAAIGLRRGEDLPPTVVVFLAVGTSQMAVGAAIMAQARKNGGGGRS